MRPLVIFAACVILLGLAPVWAQHGGGHASSGGGHAFGGGHASGGGHGAMGGHTGFSGNSGGGGHQFGGSPSSAGSAAHPSPHSSANRSGLNRSLSSRNFNHSSGRHRGPGIRIRTRDFRNNCVVFGCGWGYPYPYLGGGIDPYWWWNSGSDEQNQQYGSGPSNDVNAQNYDQSTNDADDQDVYARPAPAPRDEERTEASPATVLVFRDQHKQEVQNYAIVGQTLWTFAPQHTQKIPLTDLDLPATTKANDERGVDFRMPGGQGQGQ